MINGYGYRVQKKRLLIITCHKRFRYYYRERPDVATLVVLPDPVYPFGGPSRTGTAMIENLNLDLAGRDTFVLTGVSPS